MRAYTYLFLLLGITLAFSHEPQAVKESVEKVTYPEIVKIHPPVVHFAIALPVFTLILELFYILRKKATDGVEFLSILLSSISVISASVTGYIVHESIETLPISSEALEVLHNHETLGIILAIIFAVILLLRILYLITPKGVFRTLYLILLFVGVVLLLLQGNLGGILVYDYGVGVKR